MSINKVTIVGIKGFKGSGKNTVASMISYILHDGIMKANYDTWLLYHKNDFIENDEIIIHFADKLKDDISEFCGIDRKLLDRQDIKEENYYNFKTGIVSTNIKDADGVIDGIDGFDYDNLAPLLFYIIIILVLKLEFFFNIMVLTLLEIIFGKKLLFVILLIKHLI